MEYLRETIESRDRLWHNFAVASHRIGRVPIEVKTTPGVSPPF